MTTYEIWNNGQLIGYRKHGRNRAKAMQENFRTMRATGTMNVYGIIASNGLRN